MNLLAAAAGIVSMTTAYQRGDLDETARQGALAGPVVVEKALASTIRATQLAAIVAAPAVEDRAELLPALARVAAGPDRRVAIPAARAALIIATDLAKHELADDLAPDDLQTWRTTFEDVARSTTHPIEVRLLALDTCHALAHVLDPAALGFDLDAALKDPDPAIRAVAQALSR
jgi:hypothetical protein